MTARAPTIFPLAEFAPPVNGTVVLYLELVDDRKEESQRLTEEIFTVELPAVVVTLPVE
tara:strand:- start:137 stop:313 length:177 start_codon:yes stop_codon:yes gene_type:complete